MKSINRNKYNHKDYKSINRAPRMSGEEFDHLRNDYYIPDAYQIKRPTREDMMYWQMDGWIPVHRNFNEIGLRFHLNKLLLDLSHSIGLSLNQLSSKSFINLHGCFDGELLPLQEETYTSIGILLF